MQKMVSTRIINEKLIIMVDLKFYQNVKTEFSWSIILIYCSPWHNMCDMTGIAKKLVHMCSTLSLFFIYRHERSVAGVYILHYNPNLNPSIFICMGRCCLKITELSFFLRPSKLYLSLLVTKNSFRMGYKPILI